LTKFIDDASITGTPIYSVGYLFSSFSTVIKYAPCLSRDTNLRSDPVVRTRRTAYYDMSYTPISIKYPSVLTFPSVNLCNLKPNTVICCVTWSLKAHTWPITYYTVFRCFIWRTCTI